MKSAFYFNVKIYDFATSKQTVDCSRKKTCFFENPWGFLGFSLSLKIPEKNKASPLEAPQNCVTPVHPSEILRPKAKTPGNSTWFFLDHPWKFQKFQVVFN